MPEYEKKFIECDEVKAVDGGGALEGYAAVFGNVDGHGDIIEKGAFRKTISERLAQGRVPLLLDHKNEVNSILGTITSAVETDRGLRIRAKLADVPEADRLRMLVKSGHRLGMSIGYFPVPGGVSYKTVDGQMARVLSELKLFEASVVAVGANEEAEVASVKSLFAPVRDQIGGLSAVERKAAVAELDELRGELDEEPDADGEQPSDEPADEPDDEPDAEPDVENKAFNVVEWKRRSEALIGGRDPDKIADPAMVAGNHTRLEVLSAELDRAFAGIRTRRYEALSAELDRTAAAVAVAPDTDV